MTARWPRIIKSIEKLAGGPPPFVDVSYFSSAESKTLVQKVRRVPSHPFMRVLRESLRDFNVQNPFDAAANGLAMTNRSCNQARMTPTHLILLHGQRFIEDSRCEEHLRTRNAKKSHLFTQCRQIAEIYETVCLAVSLHKSLGRVCEHQAVETSSSWLSPFKSKPASSTEGDKLAILIGDALLSQVSISLANFNSPSVVETVSRAIGLMFDSEFQPINRQRDTLRSSSEVTTEWTQYVYGSRGALLDSLLRAVETLSLGAPVNVSLAEHWTLLERSQSEAEYYKQEKKSRTPSFEISGLAECTLMEALQEASQPERRIASSRHIYSDIASIQASYVSKALTQLAEDAPPLVADVYENLIAAIDQEMTGSINR